MRKIIITCGILTSVVWIGVLFISIGMPLELSKAISNFMPSFLKPELLKMANGFYYDVPNSDMPQAIFIFLFTIAFFIYFGLIFLLKKDKINNALIIIFFAILFRAILLPSVLIHENDVYRYIWDGKVLSEGINPYKYAPDAVARSEATKQSQSQRLLRFTRNDSRLNIDEIKKLDSLKKENPVFFERIGYKEVPTVYPPFAQIIFYISNLIKRDSIFIMKFLFVLFDISSIFIIYKILRLLKMNPNMLIVYAWSPLVIKEFANSGHLDSMAIFFLILALFFMVKKKIFSSISSLSLGILSKFFPLAALPIFLKKIKPRRFVWLFIVITAGYLPFFLMGNTAPLQVFKGLFIYGREWAINGGVFEFIYAIVYAYDINIGLSSEIFSKMIVAIIYLSILFFISRKNIIDDKAFLHQVFLSIAFLFLLSPVGDPWYFCWVVPFLCFFPYYSFIMLSWLLIFSYLSFGREFGLVLLGPLKLDRLVLFQYVPFFILLFFEMLCLKTRRLRY